MRKLVIVFIVMFIQLGAYSQKIVFVTQQGSGLSNGSSWANAFPGTSLQNAINTLSDAGGGQVWVAAGTYYPTQDTLKNSNPTDERAKTFALRNKVAVYGGFAGTESSINARSKSDKNADGKISAWEFTNETVLNGNINHDADSSNNVFHVVFQKERNVDGILLDGCTVQEGNAVVLFLDANKFPTADEWAETSFGGGLYVLKTTIKNCIVKKNTAFSYGAGIYLANSVADSCYITNNAFILLSTNKGTGFGAGVAINEIGTLSNSVISNNTGPKGSGVFCNVGGIFSSCIIRNNNGNYCSYILGGTILNSSIVNNKGILAVSNASVVSCTIAKNANPMTIYKTEILNSLIADKISYSNPQNDNSTIKYSMVYNLSRDSASNIIAPNFISFGFIDTIDYKLKGTSPAINTGMPNVGTLNQVNFDLYGNPRISYDRIDMGSFEFYSRRYVSTKGAGNFSGSGWANAMPGSQLTDATNAGAGEVWIKQGTYYTNSSKNPEDNIRLSANEKVYGGFLGNETDVSQRMRTDINKNGKIEDWEFTSTTILKPDSSLTVMFGFPNLVEGNGENENTLLDGVTIRDFKQKITAQDGGAMQLAAGLIRNCIFVHNSTILADIQNSIINLYGSARIDHCFISENQSQDGGGLALYEKSIASFCLISNNECSNLGGGVFMNGKAILEESTISNNKNLGAPSSYYGGGVYLSGGTIRNCIITNNTTFGTATRGGGVFAEEGTDDHSPTIFPSYIINSVIVNNSAVGSSAEGQDIGIAQSVIMVNNIIGSPLFVRGLKPSNIITHCVMPENITGFGIENNYSLSSQTAITNLFKKPSLFKGCGFSTDSTLAILSTDWHLNTSQFFNKGLVASTITYSDVDLAGNQRIEHDTIDIGPYEFKINNPNQGSGLDVASQPAIGTVQITWNKTNSDRYLLFVNENVSSSGSINLTNGMSYVSNKQYGLGTKSNNWSCVYNGSDTTITIDGLLQGTNYKAMLVTANGSSYLIYNDSTIDNVTIKPFITKREQTIQLTMPDTVQGVSDFIANVSTTSGLSVQLSSLATDIVSIQGTKITILKVGTAIIKAEQSGNNLFFPATVQDTIVVKKATQAITFSLKKTAIFGDADVSLNATASSGLPIQYTTSDNNIATISNGWISIKAAGTVTISATQPGNNYFTAATPVSYVLTISKASQKMSFGTLASKTFGDASFAILANATSGLPINLVSTDNSIISLAGNIATINGGGTCSIKAFQVGNNNYLASDTISQTITIAKKTQSITMDSIAIVAFGAYDIVPTVKTESNGTVNLSSNNSAVATIVNGKIHIVGVGTATITATQIGTNNFLSATTSRIIKVGKNQQSITFTTPNIKSFSDSSFVLDGISSSGLPISYTSSNSAIATISNDTVVILSSGKVTITAKQAGNANFEAASDVIRTLSILPSDQYITFNSIDTVNFGQTSQIIPVAIASSELPVSLTSYNLSVAKIVNGKIEIVGAGSSIILATQIGNTNYNQAASIKQLLVVKKATQTLTVSPIASLVYGASNVSVTASSTSGLAISIASSDPSVILVQNNMLYAVQQGSATITITQAGNDNYEPISKTQNVTVNPSAQTITFTNIPSKTYGDANFALIANSTSGLGINYVSSNSTILSIAGNIATINGAGSVTIKAYQNGNSNYAKADTVSLSITIATKTQSITMDSIPALLFGANDIAPIVKTESNGTVNLSSNNLAVATIVNGKIHVVGIGIATITATQNGTDNYLLVSTTRTVKVNKNQQSISFATPSIKSFSDSSFVLDGVTSSGLPISYTSSNSAIATISNDTVVILSTGKVTITAKQAGSADYEAANSVIRTLTIMPAEQSIAFETLDTLTYGSVSEIVPNVSSTSGLPITLTSFNLSVAKIVNGKIVIVGAGSTVIAASQNGNINYNQAAQVKQVLVVNQLAQTLKITSLPTFVYGMSNVAILAESSSKLPLTITSSSPNIIQIVNNKINTIGTGVATIHLIQNGSSGIAAIDSVIQITVNQATQTIAFPTIPIKKVGMIPFKLFATSSSGYPVTYTSSNPSVADVVENEVTIYGSGACTIIAHVEASNNFVGASTTSSLIVTALNTLKMPLYTLTRDTVIDLTKLVLTSDIVDFEYVSGTHASATIAGSMATINVVKSSTCWMGIDTLWFTATNKTIVGDVQLFGIKVRRIPLVEEIGLVTVDSTTSTHCIIAWERSQNAQIAGYILYRGTGSVGKWDSIGYVPSTQRSRFVDSTVNVQKQAYQYAMVTVDACGNRSAKSMVHTTMHLMTGVNLQNKPQIWWTPYEGADVSSYIIYRKNETTGKLDSIASSILMSYTDIDAPAGTVDYRVGIRFAHDINPDNLKSDSGPFSLSLSNMAESELTDVAIEGNNGLAVYPNPVNQTAKLTLPLIGKYSIIICNSLGQSVSKAVEVENSNSIDLNVSQLSAGVYFIKVLGTETISTLQFVKE